MAKAIQIFKFAATILAISNLAMAAPSSITNKGSASQPKATQSQNSASSQTKNKEIIKINGLKDGKIIQNGNNIVVQGGTIVSKPGTKQPLIQIQNPKNKNILVQNTRIISDGYRQDNSDGDAAIIIIENGKKYGNSTSRVKVNNVRVKAQNTTVRAKSSGGASACAGVVCTGSGKDDENNITVEIRGNNYFEAIAND
ncbi:hypothetical protein [Neisseria sp. S1]|uniref:hypothetical protein n=1 Tax=Neisseria sp. S1 TaxID=3318354 RepID=UPI003A860B93